MFHSINHTRNGVFVVPGIVIYVYLVSRSTNTIDV